MRIQDMFAKDITRFINGVIMVGQDTDAELKQELEEYVVTQELRGHFRDFFEAYAGSFGEAVTGTTGVWVSGFFGSGKSHFLKMLSYLLSGRTVAGRTALEYFEPKIADDPELLALFQRCCRAPGETVLFNIDSVGDVNKNDTAVLTVFNRMYLEHRGFYGKDLKLAQLEAYIDDAGKTDAFRAAYEDAVGKPWVEDRENYVFNSEEVIEALAAAGVMSEENADRWLEGDERKGLSIDGFADDVRRYVERRVREEGPDFHLVFCVDEIGQYIASNTSLMLNLQTVVEDLSSACQGRVWVVVTGQEAIDEVTKDLSGADFSKIQGRFKRISLSSTKMDEVISKRILEKTPVARETLAVEYAVKQNVLANLFTFDGATRGDMLGFSGADEFSAMYPFVPYQFRLIRATFDGIRKHGSSGKHTSGRERSLLSGFQESAQAVMDGDEQTLVPYWRFYDSLNTQLEGYIRGVVIRAQEAAETGRDLEPQDVPVLKTLFLLKYVDGDMQATVNNVAILMADTIDEDKVARRAQVQESLDRLVKWNFVARYGDAYTFLTDDEQDVAREINDTDVDTADVVRQIAQAFFGDVYREAKAQAGKRVFSLERDVDETLFSGRGGDLVLRVVTNAYPHDDRSAQQLTLRSADGGGELIVRLGEDSYFDDFNQAARIDRYRQTKNVAAQPEPIQAIIRQYGDERQELVERGRKKLAGAVMHGRFFVAGDEVPAKATSAAARIDAALASLVERRFPNLGLITVHYDSDAEIQQIFAREDSLDGQVPNQPAVDKVGEWLGIKDQQHVKVSMAEVQDHFGGGTFGWREPDIAACVAELIRAGRVDIFRAGAQQDWRGDTASSARLVGWLRKRSETERTEVRCHVAVDPALLNRARSIYKDFANVNAVSQDEDGLVADVAGALGKRGVAWKALLDREFGRGEGYPGREVLETGLRLVNGLMAEQGNRVAFIQAFVDAGDDLLDAADDAAEVESFFSSSQRKTFDSARRTLAELKRDADAVRRDAAAADAWGRTEGILADARPYGKVQQLPQLVQMVRDVHAGLLQRARQDMEARVAEAFDQVVGKAAEEGVEGRVSAGIKGQREALAAKIAACDLIADVTVLGNEVDAGASRAYLAVTEAVKREQAAERARERAAQHPKAGGAEPAARVDPAPAFGTGAPTAAEPALNVARVSRVAVLPPEVLTTAEEVNDYVERLRRALMQGLADHDAVQLR